MEVVTMANDDQHHHHHPHHHHLSSSATTTAIGTAAFATASPTVPWDGSQSPSPHIYPHSHHGTPAQEYSGFVFSSPQLSSNDSSIFHQRPYHQLQPLVMPQWPSMLNHMSHAPYQAPTYPPPVQPVRSMSSGSITPITSASVAPASSSRSASNPRRTLTDKDRKEMCVYAEEHPNSKQTEIGALFGVERSTVSKVLRQKEKYLQQAEETGSKSPPRKQKPRAPDIERALAVWIKNLQRKGVPITDDLIRDKARRFAATTSTPDNHQVLSTSWLEKFKLRHKIMGARSRKSSLAPAEESGSATTSRSPNEASPISPHQLLSSPALPADLHSSQSRESLVGDTHAYVDYSSRHGPHPSQSTGSLNGLFSETSPTSPVLFTPDSMSTSGSFVHPRPLLPASDSSSTGLGLGVGSGSNHQRPRSQTFPLLDQYMNQTSDYTSSIMDSPMEEASDPLLSIDHVVHDQQQHPSTIAPEQTMRPPPLPAHVLASESTRESLRPTPSAADACRAIEVVLDYFAQQPPNFLDMDESVYLERLMDKVKLRSHSTS